jgi:hypothetical protein
LHPAEEQRLRQVLQRVRGHRGKARRLVGEQVDERLLEHVVVEGAEELHAEEWPEAALGEKPKLAGALHGSPSLQQVALER